MLVRLVIALSAALGKPAQHHHGPHLSISAILLI
jgi:hypothetical protein